MLRKFTHTSKNGSLMVDASICLPLFIIALALMLSLISQVGLEESITCGMVKAALSSLPLQVASDEFFEGESFTQTALFWQLCWKNFLNEEEDGGLKEAVYSSILLPDVSYKKVKVDNLLYAQVNLNTKLISYEIEDFTDNLKAKRALLFRPFVGESEGVNEKKEESDMIVYVFPKSGIRYHMENCKALQDGCIETVLTKNVQLLCKPCKLCNANELSIGAVVWKFKQGSSTYHKKNCSCITKSYEAMTKSEAEKAGFTPCMQCCVNGD